MAKTSQEAKLEEKPIDMRILELQDILMIKKS